ncbi:uncharacterized protein [Primulina huaijiensis]|uniref:uncharacterized protein n=1 Tax=Primulina huaijiensis TaxID=1492673 RepID=UPI003CC6E0F8
MNIRYVPQKIPWIHYHDVPNAGHLMIYNSTLCEPIFKGVFSGICLSFTKSSPSKICGSPGGPYVTSPRIKLSDGRHLAYKERGVSKEEAKYKIVITHGFDDSKDFRLAVSEELIKEFRIYIYEFRIYILSFDRAGYGESDPNPKRSIRSEAFDIQELVDGLRLGPKFYLIGMSIGAYPVYSCLKYIPHRLFGA